MERLGGEDAGLSTSIGRVALASFVGTAIEGYDFFIYGIAAALVFGQLFFPPNEDPLIGTLAAFATFAVGFVARPVGGVVFGHFGDKVGRKPMLVITIVTMGLATFLIGLLPTYAQIGIWAPILLVALRLIQGFSAGGDQELVEFFDGILENNMRAAQRAKEMLLLRFQSKSSTTGGSEEPKP